MVIKVEEKWFLRKEEECRNFRKWKNWDSTQDKQSMFLGLHLDCLGVLLL